MCREGEFRKLGLRCTAKSVQQSTSCVGGWVHLRPKDGLAAEQLPGLQRVLASPGDGSGSCPADSPIRAERAGLTRRRSR